MTDEPAAILTLRLAAEARQALQDAAARLGASDPTNVAARRDDGVSLGDGAGQAVAAVTMK